MDSGEEGDIVRIQNVTTHIPHLGARQPLRATVSGEARGGQV
jgi:hypothetical protein